MELAWQRAQYRGYQHLLLPADPGLVSLNTLQHWLWQRLQAALSARWRHDSAFTRTASTARPFRRAFQEVTHGIVVKITPNDKGNPPGKLADAELHFTDGELDGLKLIGFSIWERRGGAGRNVTFPARQYSVNGERRSFALLRPSPTPARRSVFAISCWQRLDDYDERSAIASGSPSAKATFPGRRRRWRHPGIYQIPNAHRLNIGEMRI